MYKPKTCPICGETFEVKSARQKYCNRPVIRKCEVCGKEYQSKCTITYSKTCSKKCQDIYAHQQSVASYSGMTKICVLCGKEFTPKNNTQKICNSEHYMTCEVCGKEFKIENTLEIRRTCSDECHTKLRFANGNPFTNPESREKAKQTMLDKYGVEHPMHSDEIKAKLDATMQNKYGVRRFPQLKEAYKEKSIQTNRAKFGADWKSQTEDWKVKTEATLMEHYGVTTPMASSKILQKMRDNYKEKTGYDNPLQNPEVKEKIKQTNLDRFGVECAMNAPEIQEQIRQTMTDKYGAPYVLQSPILVEKIHTTNKERYGYPVATQNPEIQQKIAKTMQERYGVEHWNESWEYRKSVMTDPTKIEEWKSFLEDPDAYVASHFEDVPNYKELEEALGVNATTIQVHLASLDKLYLVKYTLSYAENELLDMLRRIDPNMNIKQHNRQLIKPYELDVFLPDYNIAIEMNPTGTHNSSIGSHESGPTPPSYHKMKTDLCEKNNVFLFHIFGYEWSHKKNIVESMLRNLTGNNLERIYARKCEIRNVPGKDAFDFLQKNHRQGGVHSKIRLGLYYNNELVSLMTFGKMRNTMGLGNEDLSDCWELVRFCNKLNTSVIGGASKLFTYFVRHYTPTRVRSFSDRAHTRGTLYQTLGFTEVSRSNENYVWVNTKDNKAYSRVNAQKHNLKKFFKDDTIDLTRTEKEIMEAHGYVQVFDSGTITWQWTCN